MEDASFVAEHLPHTCTNIEAYLVETLPTKPDDPNDLYIMINDNEILLYSYNEEWDLVRRLSYTNLSTIMEEIV